MTNIAVFAVIGALIGFPIYAINMWTGPYLPRWKRIIGFVSGLWCLSWIVAPFVLSWMQ